MKNLVFEIREVVRSIGRFIERSDEIRKNPNWRFYLVSLEDVVSHDAPGMQGDPPPWAQLEFRAEAAVRLGKAAPASIALLALWASLEGVLRRIAVDNQIPVDLLPAASLIPALHDQGLIPWESYQPLMDALEVHRRVAHRFEAPADEIVKSAQVVAEWVRGLLPTPVERAT